MGFPLGLEKDNSCWDVTQNGTVPEHAVNLSDTISQASMKIHFTSRYSSRHVESVSGVLVKCRFYLMQVMVAYRGGIVGY